MKIEILKKGFTLVEVLITLTIIGVVAAMTIPTLISRYHKKIVETKLQRIYSVMNQAIRLSTIDNGETATWDYYGKNSNEADSDYEYIFNWYNKYLAKYLKVAKVEKHPDDDLLLIYFNDDSVLQVSQTLRDMEYYTNTRCIKEECETGVDKFYFRFQPVNLEGWNEDPRNKYSKTPYFEPYMWSWNGTLEGLKNNGNQYGCYEEIRAFCAKLIQLNGWKIPDDYPYKF